MTICKNCQNETDSTSGICYLCAKPHKENITCYDCNKQIKKGFTLVYDDGGSKIKIYKCKDCYKKNPALTNFRKCEVYSRIVGYLRPLNQWNRGKKEEYKDREEYEIIIDADKTGSIK